WLQGARSKALRALQQQHDETRKQVREETRRQVEQRPAYRAARYLRRGEILEPEGAVLRVEGPHKLDAAAVRRVLGIAPGMRVPTERAKSLITRLRELGGISRESWDTTYPGERRGEFRIPGVVRRTGGMTWEQMAQALRDEGYGPQTVEEA